MTDPAAPTAESPPAKSPAAVGPALGVGLAAKIGIPAVVVAIIAGVGYVVSTQNQTRSHDIAIDKDHEALVLELSDMSGGITVNVDGTVVYQRLSTGPANKRISVDDKRFDYGTVYRIQVTGADEPTSPPAEPPWGYHLRIIRVAKVDGALVREEYDGTRRRAKDGLPDGDRKVVLILPRNAEQ